jgi:hypothetical protein
MNGLLDNWPLLLLLVACLGMHFFGHHGHRPEEGAEENKPQEHGHTS